MMNRLVWILNINVIDMQNREKNIHTRIEQNR